MCCDEPQSRCVSLGKMMHLFFFFFLTLKQAKQPPLIAAEKQPSAALDSTNCGPVLISTPSCAPWYKSHLSWHIGKMGPWEAQGLVRIQCDSELLMLGSWPVTARTWEAYAFMAFFFFFA